MRKMKKIISLIMIVALIMGVTTMAVPASTAYASEKGDSSINLSIGETKRLKVTGWNYKVKWDSLDTSIAKVSPNGVVRAVSLGTTTIIAKVYSVMGIFTGNKPKTKEFSIVVKADTAMDTSKSYNVKIGESVEVKATITGQTTYWKSSDTSIAQVDTKGIVTGISEGTVTITVTKTKQWLFFKKNKTEKFNVVVEKPDEGKNDRTYTVTFDSNGGSSIETQIVKENESAKIPTEPTRDGYLFSGWFSDEALTIEYDFSTEIIRDIILFAKWESVSDLNDSYTRAEWINEILTAHGTNIINEEEIVSSKFKDIIGHKYYSTIRTAEMYGILENEEYFFPDAVASREFSVMAAVKLLGYQGTEKINCQDVDELKDPVVINSAIVAKMIDLKKSAFCPKDILNKVEGQKILDHIKILKDSLDVTKAENEGITYNKGAILLDESTNYTDDGKKLYLSEDVGNIKKGDIVVIKSEKAFKITQINHTANGFELDYVTPELYEFTDEISISGEETLDMSKVVLADGVKIVQNPSKARSKSSFEGADVDLIGNSIELECKINDMPVALQMNGALPNVKHNFQIDWMKGGIKNAFIILDWNPDITFTLGVLNGEYDLKEVLLENKFIETNQKVKLFSYPVFGGEGLGIVLDCYLFVELDGSLSMQFTPSLLSGVQIINNQPRSIFSGSLSALVSGKGQTCVGVGIDMVADCFMNKLLSFGINPGLTTEFDAKIRVSNPQICLGLSSYFSMDLHALEDTVIGDWLNISWSIPICTAEKTIYGKDEHLEFSYDDSEGVVCNSVDICSYLKGEEKAITICVLEQGTNSVIENASIILKGKKIGKTDINGTLTRFLADEEYDISIIKEGYCTLKDTMDVERYIDGYSINFYMTPVPKDATNFSGHYYKIFSGKYSWDEAKVECEKQGGHLATITSQEEQEFINQLNSSSKRLWIGGFRTEAFYWQWVTGEKWEYENWMSGEPNNSSNVTANENSVAIWPREWNDLNARNYVEQSGFICEWDEY